MILSVIALCVLVLVHEYGHFRAARFFGVPVPEFSIGFGPRFFGWERNGTVYSLRAIPLGGYIRTADSLLRRPAGQRIIVALAGPAANLVFAYLAFTTAALVGIPQMTTRIGEVFPGLPAAVAGIRPADRVLAVDGHAVATWTEMISRIDQG
ncbi:peptidase M50, partial [bacterium]|nr:peptidase M50 [bacterium]